MNNFFTKSTGETIEPTNEFTNSGFQEIIPSGTTLHANILEATWQDETQYFNQHILIKWHITEKGKYTGFIINQKIHVFDDKPAKSDKAKEMLMAIDSNVKGQLLKLAQDGKFVVGDNMQLARALAAGAALITVGVFDMPSNTGGDNIKGNWVRSVGPVAKNKPAARQEEPAPNDVDFDDSLDVPF